MPFEGKRAADITEADILTLIDTVAENETFEFKSDVYNFPPKTDPKFAQGADAKRDELAKDVSAFANHRSGWIICGVDETKGTATSIPGLGSINPDAEKRRLLEMIRANIEPAVPGIEVEAVSMSDPSIGYVIVIRLPRSLLIPHRVKTTGMFWLRRSALNVLMSYQELQMAFSDMRNIGRRMQEFRQARVDAIETGRPLVHYPVILRSGVRIIIHVIPYSFDELGRQIDLSQLRPADNESSHWTKDHSVSHGYFNADGFVATRGRHAGRSKGDQPAENYLQIFRNGVVEFVQSWPTDSGEGQFIVLYNYEADIVGECERVLKVEKSLGMELPVTLYVTLVGTEGVKLVDHFDRAFSYTNIPTFHRPRIELPEVTINDSSTNVRNALYPIITALWNAGGYDASPSYDENGTFIRDLAFTKYMNPF